MAKILALHGPNLNLLGHREPHIYGSDTLDDINSRLREQCAAAGHEFDALQSNSEAALIDRIQLARVDDTAFMLVNFGGFTHTSIAIRDAILAAGVPFHRSAPVKPFQPRVLSPQSYFSDIAAGCVFGLGAQGYELALQAACRKLAN